MVDLLIVVAAGPADADEAASFLGRHGASAVERVDWGHDRIVVSGGPFDAEPAATVAALARAAGWPADVRPTNPGHLATWRAHTAPTIVDDRLWVCFPWSEFDRAAAPLVVEIDPVRAFGTGAHPSTLLVLRMLAARLHGGESVLDVGCGSGVLAIAAAVLGAGWTTAIDVDARAVDATQANAARNHVTLAASTDAVGDVDGEFDVVVANIGARTLIDLAVDMEGRLAPGGWMALSGLSPAQVSTVSAAFPDLVVIEERRDEDWSAVALAWPPN